MQDNRTPYQAPYGRKQLTVTRISDTGRAQSEVRAAQKKQADMHASRMRKTTWSALVCTCVICAAVLVRMIDTPLTDAVSAGVRTALTFDLSVDDAIGRLKFVQNKVQDTVTVFSSGQPSAQMDASLDPSRILQNAQVAAPFDAPSHSYLELTAPPGANVLSPDAGVVSAVSQDGENFTAAVEYPNGRAVLFQGKGCVQVKQGDALQAGDRIAQTDTAGTSLAVYLYRDGVCVDPLTFDER